jgi:putative heme-binding domain-containing protein
MAGENQTGIDPVMGLPRPAMTATLRREGAATVMVALAPTLLRKPTPEGIRLAAIAAVEKLAVRETLPLLAATVRDETAPGAERASALRAIDAIGSEQLPALVLAALETKEKLLLAQARKLAYRVSTETGTWEAGRALKTGTRAEKQAALAAVAKLQGPDADAILLAQLDALLAGKVEVGIVLDLLESASQRKNPVIAQKLAAYEAQRSSAEVLSRFQECAEGGDAKMGQEVFLENAEAGCFRCHAINGSGGDVGPELGSKDRKLSRLEVLKAIVDPNADLAPGYALVILTLRDGSVVSGSIESESSGELLIRSAADGAQQRVAKADIKERVTAPSAMPPGLGDVLGKRALRDLVEYIATLK